MSFTDIQLEYHGEQSQVAIIRLTRAAKRNALNGEMLDELLTAFHASLDQIDTATSFGIDTPSSSSTRPMVCSNAIKSPAHNVVS